MDVLSAKQNSTSKLLGWYWIWRILFIVVLNPFFIVLLLYELVCVNV